MNTHTVIVDAGTVEAWTTGDADVLESKMLDALRVAGERVTSGGKPERVSVLIVAPGAESLEADSFADYPESIGEARSEAAGGNATKWSPRDALIATLRKIDAEQLNVDALVLCYRIRGEEPGAMQTFLRERCARCTYGSRNAGA